MKRSHAIESLSRDVNESRLHAWAVLACASLLMLTSTPVRAADLPPAFGKKITIELREADVRNVYRLIGDITHTEMRIDACVKTKKLDIKLKNAPVHVVLGVMAAKLDVAHLPQPDNVVLVTCNGTKPTAVESLPPVPRASDVTRPPAEVLDRRIDLDIKDASLKNVVALLARVADVKVNAMTPLEEKVTLNVKNVRLETAMAIVRESLDLEVLDIVDGELVVGVAPPKDGDGDGSVDGDP